MPYVERDAGGAITGVFARPQPGRATERLAGDHAELTAFNDARAVASAGAAATPSALEARIALLEEKSGGTPSDAAIDAKRAAMRGAGG